MQSCEYSPNNISFKTSTSITGQAIVGWGNALMPNSFKPTSTFVITTYYNGWVVSTTSLYIGLKMNISNIFSNLQY